MLFACLGNAHFYNFVSVAMSLCWCHCLSHKVQSDCAWFLCMDLFVFVRSSFVFFCLQIFSHCTCQDCDALLSAFGWIGKQWLLVQLPKETASVCDHLKVRILFFWFTAVILVAGVPLVDTIWSAYSWCQLPPVRLVHWKGRSIAIAVRESDSAQCEKIYENSTNSLTVTQNYSYSFACSKKWVDENHRISPAWQISADTGMLI